MKYAILLLALILLSCAKKEKPVKIRPLDWIIVRHYDTLWVIEGRAYYRDKKTRTLKPAE